MLASAKRRFSEYLDYFRAAYRGMDVIVDLLGLAVLMREHVFLRGLPGLAKTHLADAFFSHIQGARVFSLQFGDGVTQEDLFGHLDYKVWREESRKVHCTEGSIVEADFALLDEFFDAPPRVARMLLSILNERRVINGAWKTSVPLWTAVATTNFNITDPKMQAVTDRFLLRHELSAPQTPTAYLDIARSGAAAKPLDPPPFSMKDARALRRAMSKGLESDRAEEILAEIALHFSAAKIYVSPRRFTAIRKTLPASRVLRNFVLALPSAYHWGGLPETLELFEAKVGGLEDELGGQSLHSQIRDASLAKKAFLLSFARKEDGSLPDAFADMDDEITRQGAAKLQEADSFLGNFVKDPASFRELAHGFMELKKGKLKSRYALLTDPA